MSFDEETSLRLIGESIGLLHHLNDEIEQIVVRKVQLVDQSLTVEVLATSEEAIQLRAQAAAVMGALSGLELDELFPAVSFTHFAVRLCDRRGDEQFWIVSSPEDASFADTGAVRWLANSIWQDNTPSYRRSIADRQIAMLETAMRDLLDFHWVERHGSEYADHVFTATLLKNLRKLARREGEDETDGRTLLDFTLLPQLSQLLCSEELLVEHGCVNDVERFEQELKALNKIRRKVAHHRPITHDEAARTKAIADAILGPAGRHHPQLVETFLVDRWDEAVADIYHSARSKGFSQGDPPASGTIPEVERRSIAAAMLADQLNAASAALEAIERLVVPPTRQARHELVVEVFARLATATSLMVQLAANQTATIDEYQAAADRHAEAMRGVRDVGDQILEMRVMEPAG